MTTASAKRIKRVKISAEANAAVFLKIRLLVVISNSVPHVRRCRAWVKSGAFTFAIDYAFVARKAPKLAALNPGKR
jgi:hypothetical protein